MRTFNVSFFAMLSCIAMIGATAATPIMNRSPVRPQEDIIGYVALQQLMEVLT